MVEGRLTARQRQGESSRERILDAAEALLAERGYAATTISKVVGRSGLPASSIYWHFSSKEDLLSAVVERGARRWLRAQPAWAHFDGDLRSFLEAVAKGLDERPGFLRLFVTLALERHDGGPPLARDTVERVWHVVRRSLERVIGEVYDLDRPEDAATRDRLARFMLACIDGVFVDAHVDPDGTDAPALLGELAVALDAMAARARSGR